MVGRRQDETRERARSRVVGGGADADHEVGAEAQASAYVVGEVRVREARAEVVLATIRGHRGAQRSGERRVGRRVQAHRDTVDPYLGRILNTVAVGV